MTSKIRMAAMLGAALALSGCLSMGKDPPPTLLNLTPAQTAPAGSGASGTSAQALAVLDIQTPARIDMVRVPVQVDAANVAYLKDAQWVDKPARLFARLLAEGIRARGSRLVVDGSDAQYAAATKLSGQLVEMGYDAPNGSVVVRYDAVLQMPGGEIRTRRFESVVPGVPAAASSVGPALNQAANEVASQVAEWVG